MRKDNVIPYKGVAYEVPRGYAGQRLTITRHLLEDDALSVVHHGRRLRLHPVDLTANAYDRRGRGPAAPPPPSEPPLEQLILSPEANTLLHYLQHDLTGYPFDPLIDRPFVEELLNDFSHLDLLEEIKILRWYRPAPLSLLRPTSQSPLPSKVNVLWHGK